MKTTIEFTSDKIDVSEAGGECFQVTFKKTEDGKYFLAQRMFEFEYEFDEPPCCYMESHISDCNGHLNHVEWNLSDNEFVCIYQLDKEFQIRIQFDESPEKINEIRKTLKTIFSRLDK